MKRSLIYLLSICICLTQAIGLLHGIAHSPIHGHTSYGDLGHPSHGGLGHEINANTSPLQASMSEGVGFTEHDKQACILFDALATAASLLKTSFAALSAKPVVAMIWQLQIRPSLTKYFDYWPTGPPTLQ